MPINLFLPTDPEIEKRKYIWELDPPHEIHCEQTTDLKSSYLLYNADIHDFQNELEAYVTSFFSIKKTISKMVLDNSINFIKELYPSILNGINLEDVYTTGYGTVIFDWEIDSDNIFSLEIGASTLGYFIEKNGVSFKQVDERPFKDIQIELLEDLTSFLD